MDNLSVAAAAGLRARMESLDLLAHNLANATTPGFKADRELYRQYVSEENIGTEGAPVLPVIEKHHTDFSQGTLLNSGGPLDVALSGKGFFTAKTPNGPVYLRGGTFQATPDGRITTREGYEVEIRTADGQPFRADPKLEFEISRDGRVRQAGRELGRFSIVEFDSGEYEKRMGNYFSFSSPKPIEARDVEVHQGKTEQANVAAPEMAVRLVNVMRQFEMLNRAIALGGEMNRRAVEEVARVNG